MIYCDRWAQIDHESELGVLTVIYIQVRLGPGSGTGMLVTGSSPKIRILWSVRILL